jgi:hypothetical protein
MKPNPFWVLNLRYSLSNNKVSARLKLEKEFLPQLHNNTIESSRSTYHFTFPVLISVSLLINILPKVNLLASMALARANLDEEETVNERVRGITADIIDSIIENFMVFFLDAAVRIVMPKTVVSYVNGNSSPPPL